MTDNTAPPFADDVAAFLETVDNKRRHADSLRLIDMMRKVTGHEPAMWGKSLIGFDAYHYKYDSGREGDSFVTGFSPRKSKLVLYINPGTANYEDLIGKLGKCKTAVSCLYINKLDDVDLDVLEELLETSHNDTKAANHNAPTRQ